MIYFRRKVFRMINDQLCIRNAREYYTENFKLSTLEFTNCLVSIQNIRNVKLRRIQALKFHMFKTKVWLVLKDFMDHLKSLGELHLDMIIKFF